jgi:hypothetical protein
MENQAEQEEFVVTFLGAETFVAMTSVQESDAPR